MPRFRQPRCMPVRLERSPSRRFCGVLSAVAVCGTLTLIPVDVRAVEYAKSVSNRLNATGRALTLPVPLRDGGKQLGEIIIQINPDDSILIDKGELIEKLSPELTETHRQRLAGVPTEGTLVSLAALKAAGFEARFDTGLQELMIEPAVDQRAAGDIHLGGQAAAPVSGNLVKPAGFSGYFNLFSGIDYLWPSAANENASTGGRLEIESGVRIRDTVIENRALIEGDVDANTCPTFARCIYEHAAGLKRQISRLIFDMPADQMRLTIGDTDAIGTTLQRTTELGGITLEQSARKFNRGESIRPTGGGSFRIERAADVDVLVNGASVRRLHLRPGTYNIRDLPLGAGANEVQLAITDDSGERRTLSFTTFSGANQLAAGKSEWSLGGGVPSFLRDNDRRYVNDSLLGTGFYRYGLTDLLTTELQLQGDERVASGGLGGIMQTPFGAFGLLAAGSYSELGAGMAANFHWDLVNFRGLSGERSESLRFSAEYRSPTYRTPGDYLTNASGILFPQFDYCLRFDAGYSILLDNEVTATLAGRYRFSQTIPIEADLFTIKGDRYGVDLTLSRPLGRAMSASLTLGYSNESFLLEETTGGSTQPDLRIGVRFNIRPDDKSSVIASYNSLDRTSNVSARRSEGAGLGRWDASVDVHQDGFLNRANANGSVGYYANRGEFRVSQYSDLEDAGLTGRAYRSGVQRTSLRAGSSIAFADGVVAVGAPVRSGAFAIVYPHASIADKEITVGTSGEVRAKADGWGAAVVGDVPSYASSTNSDRRRGTADRLQPRCRHVRHVRTL